MVVKEKRAFLATVAHRLIAITASHLQTGKSILLQYEIQEWMLSKLISGAETSGCKFLGSSACIFSECLPVYDQ